MKKGESMKCLQCQEEFESSRTTARYCSVACRVKASRVSGVSVTNPLSVTEKEGVSVTKVSVTDSEPCETVSVTGGCCQYLGANIHKDRDHYQSITYDISEEGFKRRNKHWDTHAEAYRKTIREGAIRRKQECIEHVQAVQARRAATKYQEA